MYGGGGCFCAGGNLFSWENISNMRQEVGMEHAPWGGDLPHLP
jgi:hypothetical protein